MSSSIDTHAVEHEAHEVHVHEHPKDPFYFKVFGALFVLTGVEVLTYFADFGPFAFPALMVLMVVKFFLVVSFFMHERADAKVGATLFGRLFYTGLILALAVYVAALTTFHFWGS